MRDDRRPRVGAARLERIDDADVVAGLCEIRRSPGVLIGAVGENDEANRFRAKPLIASRTFALSAAGCVSTTTAPSEPTCTVEFPPGPKIAYTFPCTGRTSSVPCAAAASGKNSSNSVPQSLHFSALRSFFRYSGYIVSAPPRVASAGIPLRSANSVR